MDGDIGTDKIYYVSQIKNACDEYRVLAASPSVPFLIKWCARKGDLNEKIMRQIPRNEVSRINFEELGSSLKLRKQFPLSKPILNYPTENTSFKYLQTALAGKAQ